MPRFIAFVFLLLCYVPASAQTIGFTEDTLTRKYAEVKITFKTGVGWSNLNTKTADYHLIHEPFYRKMPGSIYDMQYILRYNEKGDLITVKNTRSQTNYNYVYSGTLKLEERVCNTRGGPCQVTQRDYNAAGKIAEQREYSIGYNPYDSDSSRIPRKRLEKKWVFVYGDGTVEETKMRYISYDSLNPSASERKVSFFGKKGVLKEEHYYLEARWMEQKVVYDANGNFTRYNYDGNGRLRYTTRLEYYKGQFKRRICHNADSSVQYSNKYTFKGDKMIKIESTYPKATIEETIGYNADGTVKEKAIFKNGVLLYLRENKYNSGKELSQVFYKAPDGTTLLEYSFSYKAF